MKTSDKPTQILNVTSTISQLQRHNFADQYTKYAKQKARTRTQSRMPEGQKAGPKGRQLEVGAQRAPRLLVKNIFLAAFQCLSALTRGRSRPLEANSELAK